jgi:hypothetical protein
LNVKLGSATECYIYIYYMSDSTANATPVTLLAKSLNATSSSPLISTTYFTTVSLPFTMPELLTNIIINFGPNLPTPNPAKPNSVGNIYIQYLSVTLGDPNLEVFGNLTVPFGTVTANDFRYGHNSTSLATQLSTLAPINNPSFTGNVGAINIITGNLTAISDITYGMGGASLLSTINSLAPKASPTFTGTLTANGDIKFNGTTSLTSTLSAINNLRTNGTVAATTTFRTFYTFGAPAPGHRAIITVNAVGSLAGMVMCFFDWSTGSYPSLTQMASSGHGQQPNLTTTNIGTGTNPLTVQQNGTSGQIQVKATANITVTWYVTFV